MNITIRKEEEKDYRIVEEITREAFWNLYVPGCDEHYLVHTLRTHPDFISEMDYIDFIKKVIESEKYKDKLFFIRGNGEYQYSIKSLDDIMNVAFDEAGSLTDEGKRFMAMMLANNEYGFNDYLYSENNDLYNWLVADKGTNRNIALSTIGMEDYNWSPITTEQATKAGATDTVDGAPVTDLSEQFGITLVKGSHIRDVDNDNFSIAIPNDRLNKSADQTNEGNRYSGFFKQKHNVPEATETVYRLEISKETVDDDLTTKIDRAVGGIQDGQLYFYDGKVYVGIKRTDKKTDKEVTKLRLVQGQGANSAKVIDRLTEDIKNAMGSSESSKMTQQGRDSSSRRK